MTLACELPGYIGRKQPPLPVTGVMQIPMGSRVTVLAGQANKDIVRVRVNSVVGDRAGPARLLDRAGAGSRPPRLLLQARAADDRHHAAVYADRQRRHREPRSGAAELGGHARQPPQMAVQLDGIGTAITPAARVAVSGQISDDYGIGRVWFERAIDRKRPHTHPLAELPQAPAVYNLANAGLDVRELGLKPGQRLLVSVKAADLCDLGPRPERGQHRDDGCWTWLRPISCGRSWRRGSWCCGSDSSR